MTEPVYWCIQQAGSIPPSLDVSSPERFLHPDELARWAQMKIPKRQNEWLLGRLTAKLLLTAPKLPLHHTPLTNIHIDNHPEGAPFIKTPVIAGNLSLGHRDQFAVSAYTQSAGLTTGIDLEKIEQRAWSFIDDFFTVKEAAHARNLQETENKVWATLAWSAKEAILKAWQKGLRLDTRSVEITRVSPEQLNTPPHIWHPLSWDAHISGYPDCWLFWQRRGNYILTLAVSMKTGDPGQEPPVLKQITFPQD